MPLSEFDFDSDILTSREAGAYIRKSASYVRSNYKRLGLKSYRVGSQLRFRKSEIDQWLSEQAN